MRLGSSRQITQTKIRQKLLLGADLFFNKKTGAIRIRTRNRYLLTQMRYICAKFKNEHLDFSFICTKLLNDFVKLIIYLKKDFVPIS